MDELIAQAERELHALRLSLVGDDYESKVTAFYGLGDIADKLKNAAMVLGFQL